MADADDAAQEAVIRAWRHRDKCQTPDDPRGWIAAIARREALRIVVASTTPECAMEAAGEMPADLHSEEELAERLHLRQTLHSLSDADQRLLLARYWADLTQPQVAKLLGLAEGTVKVRLHRIRGHLRAVLVKA